MDEAGINAPGNAVSICAANSVWGTKTVWGAPSIYGISATTSDTTESMTALIMGEN